MFSLDNKGQKSWFILRIFPVVLGLFYFFVFPSISHAATLYWVGDAGANTSVASNWKTTDPTTCGSGNSAAAPVAADTIIFDAECDNGANIDSTLSVATFQINTGYSGVITQAADVTAATLFSQSAGTFTGDTHTLSVKAFTHTAGGTFTAPTNTVFIGTGSTYNATADTFNNVNFNKNNGYALTITAGQTMVVTGTLTFTDGKVYTGAIDSRGAINQAATFDGGSAYLDFGDNAVAQTYTSEGGIGPILRFNHALDVNDSVVLNANATFSGLSITADFGDGNTVPINYNNHDLTVGYDLSSSATIFNQASGIFNAPTNLTLRAYFNAVFTKTGGTYNEGTNTIFSGNDGTYNATAETFNNVTINAQAGYDFIITAGQTMVVVGTLTLTEGEVYTGTIDARGPINQAATFDGGTAFLDFGDNDVAQTYTIEGGKTPVLRFDNAADVNDSVVLNANATFYGLHITADFGDANAVPINYNSHDVTIGNNVDSTITCFNQASGIFNAPTNITFTGYYNPAFTKSGGTYNEGTNTIFSGTGRGDYNVATTETFNNVTINAPQGVRIIAGDTMVVTGTLTLSDGTISTGTIDVRGNINQAATFDGGTGFIDFGDNAIAQTYTTEGGKAPILRFDNAADANDSVVLNANATFSGLHITADFGDANTVPINYNNYDLTVGSASDSSVTIFNQASGIFNAPSTISFLGYFNVIFTKSGGTYNEGTNTIFSGNGNSEYNVVTTESFNNVTVNKTSGLYITAGDTMVVNGTLTLTDGILYTGTIDARGNINQAATFDGGSTYLDFGDNAVAQTYTTEGGKAPVLRFDNTADANDSVVLNANATFSGLYITADFGDANTVPINYNNHDLTVGTNLNSSITIFNQASGLFNAPTNINFSGYGNAIFTKSGGTYNEGANTVFSGQYSDYDVATTETFNNVTINMTQSLEIVAGDMLIVAGTLTLTKGPVYTGTISAQGSVVVASTYDGGSAILLFSGSNTQTFDLTGATGLYNGDILVNKTGGQVNLLSALVLDASGQDFIIQSGVFDLNGNNLTVESASNNQAIAVNNSGTLQLQGAETITAETGYPRLGYGSTVKYDGLSGPYIIKNYLYYNLTVDGAGNTFALPASLTLGDLTISAGTLDVTVENYNLTISGDISISGVLNNRSNTVTLTGENQAISGNITFNNFSIVKYELPTPLLYWEMEEVAAGSSVIDSSGNGYDGTPSGTGGSQNLPQPNLDVPGQATSGNLRSLHFDGTDDKVAVALLQAPVNKTFSMWVKGDAFPSSLNTLLEFSNDNPWFGITSAGKVYLYGKVTSTDSIVPSEWYHVAFVSDNVANTSKIFINGVQSGPTGVAANHNGVSLGLGFGVGDPAFRGFIDDLRIYDVALLDSDMQILAANGGNVNDSTITFAANSTTIVNGILTITGTDVDSRVNLVSSVPGTHWNLNSQGSQGITWVDVMDSDASSGNLITHTNAVNSGNNHNWGFDETTPTITNVSSDKADGTYGPGEVIDVDFTFSEAITTTGDITVTLNSGGTCVFNGVTNSGTASCNYTVQSGQSSSDLTVSSAVGTINDQSGNGMADFTPLTNLAANKALVIDGTGSTIQTVNSNKANGRYKVGDVIDIDLTFDEAVTGSGTVTLETGATDRTCDFTVSNSTTTSCDYTVQAGDNSSDLTTNSVSGTIADQYGNNMSNFVPSSNLAANKALVIDTAAPTITNVSSDKTDGTYGTSAIIDIDVTFSEAITSTGSITVTLETGTTDRTCTFTVSNSSTASCNYVVQAGDTTSDLDVSSIAGTIADQAGNSLTNFVPATNLAANKALVIDTNPPIIQSISSNKANGRYKAGEVIDIDLTFSEAVTVTGSATVTLETGATDQTCTFTADNSTTATCDYTVQSGDNSSDLTVNSVSGTILDSDGNPMSNFVPTTNLAASKAIIIDTIAPTISSVSSDVVNGTQGAGTVIDIDVYFSENVTTSGLVTITLNTGRTCTFSATNSTSASCNYTVQTGDYSTDLDTSSIAGTIADQAGNGMVSFAPTTTLAANKALVVDGAGPTIQSISSDKANGRYKAGEVIDIDLTFTEAVTGSGTVTLETGATDRTCDFTVSNSTTTSCDYTVQAGDNSSDLTTNSVSGTIADQYGNAISDFTPTTNLVTNKDIVVDTTVPLLSSHTPIDEDTGVALTANLILNFSEIVNIGSGNIYIKKTSDNSILETIDVASAQVTGGGTSIITINPSVTYPELTSLFVEIPTTIFVDRALNPYGGISGGTVWNFSTTDATAPTILSASSTKTDGSYTLGTLIDIVLTFSEKVTGSGTITVESGSTDRTCTFNVVDSLTASCNYTVQLNDTSTDLTVKEVTGTIADQYGNPLINFTPAQNLAFNNNLVIDTIAPIVLSFAPSNNATGVVATNPYVIVFSEPVVVGVGNITIKRSSDNATIETIPVGDAKITGSGTDTITINHTETLSDTTLYYIQIGDVALEDIAGNHFSGIIDSSDWRFTTRTTNQAPVVTTPTTVAEATDGSGEVTFKLDVTDADLQKTELNLKYSTNQNDWYNLTVKKVSLSNGTADINNDNQRQINSIDTDFGKQTLTITWDAKKDLGVTELDNVYLRATAHDGTIDGTSAVSDGFGYDSRAPETSNLQVTNITETTISLSWTTPRTERNFAVYKVCFGSTLANAESCQNEWNKANDKTLENISTGTTKIIGLAGNTNYYFSLFASDTYGNESKISTGRATTLKPIILCTNDCYEPIPPTGDDQGEDNNNQGGGGESGGADITPRPKASSKPTALPTPSPEAMAVHVKDPSDNHPSDSGSSGIAALPEIYINTLKGIFGILVQDKNLQKLNTIAVGLSIATVIAAISTISSVIGIIEVIPHLFRYLIHFLLSIFSFQKKRRSWGRVINFYTGAPIAGALVLVIDAHSGKVKTQEYTNTEGYFASFLPAGEYFFQVSRAGYVLVNEQTEFVTQSEELYQGSPVTVKEERAIALVLALKPVAGVPNKFKQFILKELNYFETFFSAISWPILLIGFTINMFIFCNTKSIASIIIFIVYLLIATIKLVIKIKFKQTLGIVSSKKTSEGIGLAILRLYDASTNRLLTTKATTESGKFMLLTVPGKYNLTVVKEGYPIYQANNLIVRTTTNALAVRVELG